MSPLLSTRLVTRFPGPCRAAWLPCLDSTTTTARLQMAQRRDKIARFSIFGSRTVFGEDLDPFESKIEKLDGGLCLMIAAPI